MLLLAHDFSDMTISRGFATPALLRRITHFWSDGEDRQATDRAVGARAILSTRQRLVLLASCALLIALRLPKAWIHGRFLGEEGTIFLAYAWHHAAGDALWRSFLFRSFPWGLRVRVWCLGTF